MRFLRRSGQTVADLRRSVRTDLLSTRLRSKVAGTGTEAERQERLATFVKDFTGRWQEATTCSPRYHAGKVCRPLTRQAPGR